MAERGRPRQYDVSDRQLCMNCKYYHTYSACCGYMAETGKSRIYSEGKMRMAPNKCDKYTSGHREYKYEEGKEWIFAYRG